ncbi:MAG: hypothetical protein ACFIN3_01310 [Candidatus Walczuchella monophlebidarum]
MDKNCVDTTIISHSERMANKLLRIEEILAVYAYYPQWEAFYSPY